MKLYATNTQRACSTLIDFFIYETFVRAVLKIVLIIVRFDSALLNAKYDMILDEISYMLRAIEVGESYDMNIFIAVFKDFMSVYYIPLIITMGASLIFVIGYLVVLPMIWKKQTVGRMLAKCKVVKGNNEPIKVSNLILREIVGTFLLYIVFGGWIVLISIILVLITKRSLVDFIGRTELVVDVPKHSEEEINEAYRAFEEYQRNRRNKNDDDVIDAKYKDLDDSDTSYSPFDREDNSSHDDDNSSDDEYKIF